MIKNLTSVIFIILISSIAFSQTPLTEAINFHVKTIEGEPIWLFDKLDIDNKIVVIDFFSTSCGPCQDYADDFQACYEKFGYNNSNTYFMGINWGNDNDGVHEFDSIHGLTYPSVSGSQGGGNIACNDYLIMSYPTVIIITPDHNIVEQYIYPPTEDSITNAVIAAGGIIVGTDERVINSNVNLYPNPMNSNGKITFSLEENKIVNLRVLNQTGQTIISTAPSTFATGLNEITFSVSEIENGYYIVVLETENQIFKTLPLIISH